MVKKVDPDALFKKMLSGSVSGQSNSLDQDKNHDANWEKVVSIKESLIDNKASDVRVYSCRPDYFVEHVIVVTGTSSRHMAGMCERTRVKLKSDFGLVAGVDDKSQDWMVMDVGFVMVHLLNQSAREKYSIDDLMLKLGNVVVVD